MEMLDEAMIHVPDRTELDGMRLQNGAQLKTYKLFLEFSFNIFRP